ncbi:MAG: oligosaccharide flippase family protein [Pseudomonadota bacterium]
MRHLLNDRLTALLVRGGIGSLAVNSGNIFLSMAAAFLLARLLGPEDYGVYAYVFAVVGILALPAQFGLPVLVLRETAAALATRDWPILKGIWLWAIAVATAMCALSIAAGFTATLFAGSHFSVAEISTFYWGLALIPLLVFVRLCTAAVRGLQYRVTGQVPDAILRPGTLALILLTTALVYPGYQFSSNGAMRFHCIAASAALLASAIIFWAVKPDEIKTSTVEQKHRNWISSALPLGLVAGLQLINYQIDILMLGLFMSADDIGIYRVMIQAARIVYFCLHTINVIAIPTIAQLHAIQDWVGLQRLVTLAARIAFGCALFPAILLYAFGQYGIFVLLGAEYESGTTAMIILAVAHLLTALTGLVMPLLSMIGLERLILGGVSFGIVVNVLCNAILVPILGINGAAWATLISTVCWNIILCWGALQHSGIHTTIFGKVRIGKYGH